MPPPTPTIYLIAGCNGAGKATFAKEFLPKEVKCLRFLNADEMARGLSPLDPAAGAVKAARLLLHEIRDAIRSRQTFGLETTLSGLTYVRLLINAREQAYAVNLISSGFPRPQWRFDACASVCVKAATRSRSPTFAGATRAASATS